MNKNTLESIQQNDQVISFIQNQMQLMQDLSQKLEHGGTRDLKEPDKKGAKLLTIDAGGRTL